MATIEALPEKYACATLNARGRKLPKVPRRTADAYAQCKEGLAASDAGDLRMCLRLTELLHTAPRDEVLSDNVATRACARGSKQGCRKLAESRLGSGVRFDPICAEQLLDTLCAEGELGSCFRLGKLKLEGDLVVQDVVAGLGLIERACNQGEYMACHALALRGEVGSTENRRFVERAFEGAAKACVAEDAAACLQLAMVGPHRTDKNKRRELTQRACALGSLAACGTLGRRDRTDVYKDECDEEPDACTGATNAKDDPRYEYWSLDRCAAGWDDACVEPSRVSTRPSSTTPLQANDRGDRLESACLKGAAGACALLARGKLVPLQPTEKVLRAGCDLGLAASCKDLAEAAEAKGDRVAQLQYLERACPAVTPQGPHSISRSACRMAGMMYKDGVGASQDLGRAAILLQKGCVEQRYVLDGEACVVLGTMYEGGMGVQKSLSRALDLYAAGCAEEKNQGRSSWRAESKARVRGPVPSPKPAQNWGACARLGKWVEPRKDTPW